MALILNIDTATEKAIICLSNNGVLLGYRENEIQKEHAAFVHNSIAELLLESSLKMKEICAVAVTAGPGSYTGVRVAMSAAKGICYALEIPIISLNTLKVMTYDVLKQITKPSSSVLFCPMIDARRMEVFMALFDSQMNILIPPQPAILDQLFLENYNDCYKIILFGSGSYKFKEIRHHENFDFLPYRSNARNLATMTFEAFEKGEFASLAYSEPLYAKNVNGI